MTLSETTGAGLLDRVNFLFFFFFFGQGEFSSPWEDGHQLDGNKLKQGFRETRCVLEDI